VLPSFKELLSSITHSQFINKIGKEEQQHKQAVLTLISYQRKANAAMSVKGHPLEWLG
jgi:hypothetical protein